jgi:L-malate glycosyltransferase
MVPKIHYHSQAQFFSGAENMLVNFLSSQQLRNKFDVSFSYLYSKKYTEGLNQRIKLEIPVYPLHFPEPSALIPTPKYRFNFLKRVIEFFSRIIFSFPVIIYEIWVLRKIFRDIQPDILHINNAGYPAALSARIAAIAAQLAGVPHTVMVVNNMAVGYRRPSRWFNYPLDRLVANSVSIFVTGSTVASQKLKKVLRLDSASCMVIHNGITFRNAVEEKLKVRERLGLDYFDGVVFGVVAILRHNKGHQVLLNALLKLLKESKDNLSNIKIMVEGDGPIAGYLKSFVIENQLSKYCIFIGNEKNVRDFIQMVDVIILPSISNEDFPNIILEAMGLGKAVIASRLAGTPEQVVDGETGLLVTGGDSEQLALAIEMLSLNKQLRIQMGQAGLRRFDKFFTSEVSVKNYITLYQSLIETKTI